MLGGAYSSQFKNLERQQFDTIKTLAENEKTDQLARSKKLSLETNKRRRALVLKRKNDAEREEKRRQLILSKRRERQKEATERFQRAHMPPRPSSGISNSIRWSPRRTTQLEDALRIVRGSPATSRVGSARTQDRASPTRASYYRQNSDPLSKPYFNKYAHPTINQTRNNVEKREELHNKSLHNLNASRSLFEKQLESHQQSLLEQQQNALQEFNNQLMKEVELDRNVTSGKQNERTESLSSVDSLEETVSNDTVRESCDLDTFDNKINNIRTDTGSNGTGNVVGHQFYASPNIPQSIDSYNTQVQSNGNHTKVREDDKQQFYQQRQLEIQQQLQEQQQQQLLQQQKQQQELQLRLQEKQQQLLHVEFQKQQEQLQENNLRQYEKIAAGHNQPNHSSNNVHYIGTEEEKENHRPSVELKVCTTPSAQPPTSVSETTSAYTNASPYSAKSTNTNMTTVTTYDKSVIKNDCYYINSEPVSTSVSQSATPQPKLVPQSQTLDTNSRSNGYVPNRDLTSQGSFLETVTKDLTKQQSDGSRESESSSVTNNTLSNTANGGSQKSTNQPISKNGTNNLNSPKTNSAVTGKPPASSAFYLNSYSSAYAVRQNLQQQQQQQQHSKTVTQEPAASGPVTTVDASRLNVKGFNGAQQAVESRISLFTADPFLGDENQDTADTDSVSTIACEDREPEAKEVKSILKRSGSARGGLKKSGPAGNVNRHDIRDSLEITRVHLQTSAEEKEQRPKKNVRFADLTYDKPETLGQQAEDNKLFVKRNTGVGHNGTSHQRPVSAVSIKTVPPRMDQKPPRASSATVRASTIPRAKTQVVRPQAAAHIIQSPPSSNLEKKVTIVNNNFMEKIPSSLRGNQPVHRASPSMVYTVGSRSDQQKVNYAVSSIVMPKGNSAPFIYPGTIQPSSSTSGPAQNVTNSKYEGAVYDDNGLRIDRTPTDDEINFLWDKVRTCLSRNSNAGDNVQMESHRQAAPVANTYIDGNALGQFNSMNRVAAPPYGSNPAVQRQNSLDGANGSYAKRYGLLQQRKQQTNPNSLKSRQQLPGQGSQGYPVHHAPVQSYNEPQQTGQANGEVSESMAEFLTAEQMSEQSVSESRIHQAMDEAHVRQQAYIASKPTPSKPKSALSMEEQRLMESLDRLNDKLKEQNVQPLTHQTQQNTQQQQPSPQQVLHVSGFKGHQPLHSQRRVIESANPRLKITSATLKRHLHRHQ